MLRVVGALTLATVIGLVAFAAVGHGTTRASAASQPCPLVGSPLVVPVAGARLDEIRFDDDSCQHVYVADATNNRIDVYSLQSQTSRRRSR